MKTDRLKKGRKRMAFYINNYKFRVPFQILIDGTFAFACLQNKIDINDQLSKYLQSKVKLLTTPCVITESEKLGLYSPAVNGATIIMKNYPVHKCSHGKKFVSGNKCLTSMIANMNPTRYIIATQDRELQETVRSIPGVPLIYLHGNNPTLEAASQVSLDYAKKIQSSLGFTSFESEKLKIMKKEAGLEENKNENIKKKKKKKGGPNPLSCKKKQKPNVEVAKSKNINQSGKIKKKKKIRIAPHIKEVLMEQIRQEKGII